MEKKIEVSLKEDEDALEDDEFDQQTEALIEKIRETVWGSRSDVLGTALARMLARLCVYDCDEPELMFTTVTSVFVEEFNDPQPYNDDEQVEPQPDGSSDN